MVHLTIRKTGKCNAEKTSNPIAQSLIDQRPEVIPEELRAEFAEMP